MLVHDAQFVAGEDAVAAAYGHALVDDAIELARTAGVGQLWLFHHGPDRSDDAVAAIATAAASDMLDVRVATEQTVVHL